MIAPLKEEPEHLLRDVRIKNFLSFDSEGVDLKLDRLNVLIGRNGVGKSNLISALRLLSLIKSDCSLPMRQRGGISEWMWKGGGASTRASIGVRLYHLDESAGWNFDTDYSITFAPEAGQLRVYGEELRYSPNPPGLGWQSPDSGDSSSTLTAIQTVGREIQAADYKAYEHPERTGQKPPRPHPEFPQQVRIPLANPILADFARGYERNPSVCSTTLGNLAGIRIYDSFHTAANPGVRSARVDLPDDYLSPGRDNLALVVKRICENRQLRTDYLTALQKLYPGIIDLGDRLAGGQSILTVYEEGFSNPIPASHLSDGTLNWMALLAVLLDPAPPPVVCIEEPEIGLHPDLMPTLADLLLKASKCMQLIITTHSVDLLDAFSSTPEVVVVCEKERGATSFSRLDQPEMKEQIEEHGLGNLWTRGVIGGKRW